MLDAMIDAAAEPWSPALQRALLAAALLALAILMLDGGAVL